MTQGESTLKQHQQRRQPSGEHRFTVCHTEHKFCSGNGPTFWTTPSRMQAAALVASPSPSRAFITGNASRTVARPGYEV